MFAQQVLFLPHFLEDQYVWLSIGTWAVLLLWLRHRASRRRVLMWAGLAGALHLTPVAAQVIRGNAAINVMAHDMPLAFWTLQAVNLVVLTTVVGIGYFSLRRVAQGRQMQAVMAERRRIANDLHDGVGSRLVALLASQDPKTARSDGLSMALQACLLELQMTVDDLDDQTHATVFERLGHLRYRLRPAFERMGIALEWNIAPEALECTVRADTATQVCRVVQEALSNTLRHSRATRVELRVGPQEPARSLVPARALVLEVRDNGCGRDTPAGAPRSPGKGLRSMRSRADAIGGELAVIDLEPHGLCVRLVVPCQASASEPHSVLPESESML